jgi:hypothetical protein
MTCEADVDELVIMFKKLRLEDKVGPDEVLEIMDIDERGCANTCEAFDIDGADVHIGDVGLEQTGSNVSNSYHRCDNQSNSSLKRLAGILSGTERWRIRHSESQFNEKAVSRRLVRVTSLSKRLIGQDPIGTFADNYEKAIPDWIKFLRETSLPNGITSEDPRIVTAFRVVDNVICGQGTALLQRLANVQLIRLFSAVKGIIKSERENWRVHREPYYRDASIAMDIYMSAQEPQSNMTELRLKLKYGRKRFSKRWSDLATLSPLFVLVYSSAAEAIVYVTITH